VPATVFSRRPLATVLLVAVAWAWPSLVVAQEPSASPVLESASPSAAPFDGQLTGSWDVTAYDPWAEGLVAPRQNTTLTVSLLTGGRLEGETGCGRYHGGYTLDGERLGLGIISKGFGECGTRKNEEAVAFSVALGAVKSWRASATGAELLDENGRVRAILERSTAGDAVGQWVVERYRRVNGQWAQPLVERPMLIAFGEDGEAAGSTGCRLFEGEYRSEGDRMVVGPIETIGLPCEGPERKPERRLLAVLGEVVHWQRSDDVLALTDAFDTSLVELRLASTIEPSATAMPAERSTPSEPGASTVPREAGE
jgi:heat shock protein HslJ